MPSNFQAVIKYRAPSWQYVFKLLEWETGLDANEQAKAHLVTVMEFMKTRNERCICDKQD